MVVSSRMGVNLVIVTFLVIVLVLAETASGRQRKGFFLKPEAFDSGNVRSTSRKLKSIMHTSCLNDRIYITFSQKEMIELGILPNQISLEDSQCIFSSNETHYVAQVVYRSLTCGSRHTRDAVNGLHTIDNSVRFMPPSLVRKNMPTYDDEDEVEKSVEGSGAGEEGQGEQLHMISIQFQCQYRYAVMPYSSTIGPLSDPSSTLYIEEGDKDVPSSLPGCPDKVISLPCNCKEQGANTDKVVSEKTQGVDVTAVICVAIAAFFLGVALSLTMCCMWSMHQKSRKKTSLSVYDSRSSNDSDEYGFNCRLTSETPLTKPSA